MPDPTDERVQLDAIIACCTDIGIIATLHAEASDAPPHGDASPRDEPAQHQGNEQNTRDRTPVRDQDDGCALAGGIRRKKAIESEGRDPGFVP